MFSDTDTLKNTIGSEEFKTELEYEYLQKASEELLVEAITKTINEMVLKDLMKNFKYENQ